MGIGEWYFPMNFLFTITFIILSWTAVVNYDEFIFHKQYEYQFDILYLSFVPSFGKVGLKFNILLLK